MLRRDLLKAAGLSLGSGPCAGRAAAEKGSKRLIVILLRGAVDGLSVVAPW